MVCTQGRVDDAKLLVDLGKADVNLVAQSLLYEKSSPIMAAARNGHVDIVTMLLDSGADLDATTTRGCFDEFDGRWEHNEEILKGELIRTALSLAAEYGQLKTNESCLIYSERISSQCDSLF